MFEKKKIKYNENTHKIDVKDNNWKSFWKPENLINSIIAVLTLISVILVFFTLLEMKQQRESTYMPKIAIRNDKEFIIKWDSENPDFYVRGIDYGVLEGSGIKSYGIEIPHLYFTVENIGFGSARNIKFIWNEDTISKFAECINSIDFYSELEVLEDGNQKIIISMDERIFDAYWSDEFMIPYINAAGNENITQKLDADIFGYLVGLSILRSDEIPNIELKIIYEDIYGKEYEANVVIKATSTYLKKNKGNEYLINFDIKMEYRN